MNFYTQICAEITTSDALSTDDVEKLKVVVSQAISESLWHLQAVKPLVYPLVKNSHHPPHTFTPKR